MYPLAKVPNKIHSGKIKTCIQCRKKIVLSKWDAWNGFLVRCPYCKRINGENWNVKVILLGSFFFHALSFLFTMRLYKAVLFIALFALVGFLGNYILEKEFLPQPVDTILAIIFLLSPLVINGVLIFFHEKRLNHSTKTQKQQALSLIEEVVSFLT